MVAIQLDPIREKRLAEVARQRGQAPTQAAQHILEDYLDFQGLPEVSDEAWARASVALTPEVMEPEDWGGD